MKRDMHLCLQILSAVEKQSTTALMPVRIEGRAPEEVGFHLMLLKEAGYVDAEEINGPDGESFWQSRRLTWAGYEFLEKERSIERRTKSGGSRI